MEKLNYDQALNRLEEIANTVRKKEVSLEDSLDLLEESIQLATFCNQQIDYSAWVSRADDDPQGRI
ncbi:MAG: exodeoxyribonuclease VII small subunit [Actinobacteria bacterium]|nr:exodeoxyribonuclease VII small subunit [Actinomycetota bacterium]